MELTAEVVKKYTPMMKSIIKKKLSNTRSSDFVDDFDDHFQDCIEYLKYACDNFSEDRNCKESTYFYMVLSSRIGNKKNKAIRNNRNNTIDFSNISFGAADEAGDFDLENAVFAYSYQSEEISSSQEDYLNMLIDAKSLYKELDGIKKIIFEEHFIKRKKICEIVNMYPNLKYYHIKKNFNILNQAIKTLIKGKNYV